MEQRRQEQGRKSKALCKALTQPVSFYKLPIKDVCFFFYFVHIDKHFFTIPSEEI